MYPAVEGPFPPFGVCDIGVSFGQPLKHIGHRRFHPKPVGEALFPHGIMHDIGFHDNDRLALVGFGMKGRVLFPSEGGVGDDQKGQGEKE